MENDQEYIDMSHVADIVSYEKEEPKVAVKAQFAMWVSKKIQEIEARLAAVEGNKEEAPESGAEEGEAQV